MVYSLSRLSRSTKDTLQIAEKLDKAGADLVSLSEKLDTTSASGKMVFRLMAVLTEFERDQVSERTKAALNHKKAMGLVYPRSLTVSGGTETGSSLSKKNSGFWT